MVPLLMDAGVDDFNPRSPWGERLSGEQYFDSLPIISIHAPRGGSDSTSGRPATEVSRISIHAPRGGSDAEGADRITPSSCNFNPRSPWGERHAWEPGRGGRTDFNPRSPWGERPAALDAIYTGVTISIHAPRGGSDCLHLDR